MLAIFYPYLVHSGNMFGVGQVDEVEELFTGNIKFRDINVPYERVKAKPL